MKISIIGLGHFGSALARELVGHEISGTTRSESKAALLRQEGLRVEILDCPQLPSSELLDQDLVVINIPPRPEHLKWFQSWPWQKARVIFIGSTSVYGDAQGEVNEQTLPAPDTISGEILLKQELFFKSFPDSCIVRFGGLIGEGRHPGKFLSGRSNLEGGERVVNLIHHLDTICFIKDIIENPRFGVFNLVHPHHPTREDYYRSYCTRHDLALPEFILGSTPYKTVQSSLVPGFYTFRASLYDE
jgi:nucleoside-diphosphate-sugar epimerase